MPKSSEPTIPLYDSQGNFKGELAEKNGEIKLKTANGNELYWNGSAWEVDDPFDIPTLQNGGSDVAVGDNLDLQSSNEIKNATAVDTDKINTADASAASQGEALLKDSSGTDLKFGSAGLSDGDDFDGQGTSEFTNLKSVDTDDTDTGTLTGDLTASLDRDIAMLSGWDRRTSDFEDVRASVLPLNDTMQCEVQGLSSNSGFAYVYNPGIGVDTTGSTDRSIEVNLTVNSIDNDNSVYINVGWVAPPRQLRTGNTILAACRASGGGTLFARTVDYGNSGFSSSSKSNTYVSNIERMKATLDTTNNEIDCEFDDGSTTETVSDGSYWPSNKKHVCPFIGVVDTSGASAFTAKIEVTGVTLS